MVVPIPNYGWLVVVVVAILGTIYQMALLPIGASIDQVTMVHDDFLNVPFALES